MHMKSGKWGWFALKIDHEKAYDRIEWSFMMQCLEDHDLEPNSIRLIMNCISQASSSILINGIESRKSSNTREASGKQTSCHLTC